MSPDDHRSPSRLASSRPNPARRRPQVSDRTDRYPSHTAPLPGLDPTPPRSNDYGEYAEYNDRTGYENPVFAPRPAAPGRDRQSGRNDYDRVAEPPYAAPPESLPSPTVSYESDPEPADYEPEDYRPADTPRPDPGYLTNQERNDLLMRTVALYDDAWKLAGIRADSKNNRLHAFLTPRNKRIDLRTAVKRKQALVITIDIWGNAEVKEPQKPNLWSTFISWLHGE